MDHPNLTVDMGTHGEFDLTIKFTDQNCITHSRTFNFSVYGEKPTYLVVEREREERTPVIIYRTTERGKD